MTLAERIEQEGVIAGNWGNSAQDKRLHAIAVEIRRLEQENDSLRRGPSPTADLGSLRQIPKKDRNPLWRDVVPEPECEELGESDV